MLVEIKLFEKRSQIDQDTPDFIDLRTSRTWLRCIYTYFRTEEAQVTFFSTLVGPGLGNFSSWRSLICASLISRYAISVYEETQMNNKLH